MIVMILTAVQYVVPVTAVKEPGEGI